MIEAKLIAPTPCPRPGGGGYWLVALDFKGRSECRFTLTTGAARSRPKEKGNKA